MFETYRNLYINVFDTIIIREPPEENQVFSTEIIHKAQSDAKIEEAVGY
jgi:hypothetical protein